MRAALSVGIVVSLLVGVVGTAPEGAATQQSGTTAKPAPVRSAEAEREWQKISTAASKLELDNKTADAVALIQTYLARHANDGEAHFVQARFYEDLAGFDPAARTPAQRKHLESAARHYLRAADLLPDLDARFVSLWKTTNIYSDGLNQPSEAERVARRLVKEQPERAQVHLIYANLLHQRGDLAGALEGLRAARARVSVWPLTGQVQFTQYVLESVQTSRDVPRETLRQLLDDAIAATDAIIADPQRTAQEYRLGTMARAMALELMAERVETDRQRRIALLVESERYGAAIAEHRDGRPPAPRRLTPAQADVLEWEFFDRWQGRLVDGGRFDEAIAAYQRYSNARPTFETAYARTGEVYVRWADETKDAAARSTRLTQALVPLQRVVGLAQSETAREEAFLAVIDVLSPRRLNQPAQIEAACRTMVQRYPRDVGPRAALAIALYRGDRATEAAEVLRIARTALSPPAASRAGLADRLVAALRSNNEPPATASRLAFHAADQLLIEAEKIDKSSADVMEARARWLILKADRFEADPARAKALQAQAEQLLERAFTLRKKK